MGAVGDVMSGNGSSPRREQSRGRRDSAAAFVVLNASSVRSAQSALAIELRNRGVLRFISAARHAMTLKSVVDEVFELKCDELRQA
jgi:hypothetical protein